MLPGRSTGRVTQNIGLSSNPHADKIELLELQRPVGHLLAASTIIELGLREDVVLVIDVAIQPKSSHETLHRDHSLPQSVQLALHRRPALLDVRKPFCHNCNNFGSSVGRWALSQRCCPTIVARVDEHLQGATREFRSSRSFVIDVGQRRAFRQHRPNRAERCLVLRVRGPQGFETDILLSEGPQRQFVLDPLWIHVVAEIIDKTKERIHGSRGRWYRPLCQLLDLPRLGASPLCSTDAPP